MSNRVVTLQQMQSVITEIEAWDAARNPQPRGNTAHASFDLEDFLSRNMTVKRGPEAHDGGERWIVQCPFHADHGGTSAAVLRLVSGALVFKCQHNGCRDRRWEDVRRNSEPGYREWRNPGAAPHESEPSTSHADQGRTSDVPRLLTTRADLVRIERVEWLCEERVPIGGITLFDGEGGIGKTTFLTGVIAAASCGRDFFSGAVIQPQSTLIVGVEDRRALIAQRLKLYNADMTRIQFVDAARLGGREYPLVIPDHIGILEGAVVKLGVGFVYVDALFSHIALDGEGRMSQQVRMALQPLVEMCERRNVAFAAMRHWTKTTGSALSRAYGSAEFTNVARSVLAFGTHPADENLVVCAHSKSNYGKRSHTVAFRKAIHEVYDDNGKPWTVSVAADVGIVEGISSDDLAMRAPCDPDERGAAADWLCDHLADGNEHPTESVLRAARQASAGSRRTLQRAANNLGVIVTRTQTYPSVGMWRLPLTDAPKPTSEPKNLQSRHIQIYGTTGQNLEKGAPQTLTQQGSRSRATVAPPDFNDATDGATGASAFDEYAAGRTSAEDEVRL